jgi:hypothetical protein
VDHVRGQFEVDGTLTLRWEDGTGGGDGDFNDMVINVDGMEPAKDGVMAYLQYDADATDGDGDVLTYALASAPEGATIDAATGLISWSTRIAGTYSFSVTAADDKGGVATQTFTVTVQDVTVQDAGAAGTITAGTSDSATITVESSLASEATPVAEPVPVQYVVVNQDEPTQDATTTTAVTGVDWTTEADVTQMLAAARKTDEWVIELLEADPTQEPDPEQLAQQTGLKVDL